MKEILSTSVPGTVLEPRVVTTNTVTVSASLAETQSIVKSHGENVPRKGGC